MEDGAIEVFTIFDGGSGYEDGDLITLDTNGSGQGFVAKGYIANGVLDGIQSFTNGAIASKGEKLSIKRISHYLRYHDW